VVSVVKMSWTLGELRAEFYMLFNGIARFFSFGSPFGMPEQRAAAAYHHTQYPHPIFRARVA
jgi:hypothetical protein